jgi:Bacteriophage lambda head decoration protein D
MPVLNEGRYAGEFVVSEGNGKIWRETITVLSGQNVQDGAVLGKVTASGKYKALDPAAADGSQSAAGILYDAADATAADAERDRASGRSQCCRAGLARRHHLGPEDHGAWPAGHRHHHRPLTPGPFLKGQR